MNVLTLPVEKAWRAIRERRAAERNAGPATDRLRLPDDYRCQHAVLDVPVCAICADRLPSDYLEEWAQYGIHSAWRPMLGEWRAERAA